MKKIISSIFILGLLMLTSCSKGGETANILSGKTYIVIGGDLLPIGETVEFQSTYLVINDIGTPYTFNESYISFMSVEEHVSWKYAVLPGTLLLSDGVKDALLKKE